MCYEVIVKVSLSLGGSKSLFGGRERDALRFQGVATVFDRAGGILALEECRDKSCDGCRWLVNNVLSRLESAHLKATTVAAHTGVTSRSRTH